MSESKRDLSPDDPAYYAPRRLRDIGAVGDKNWQASTGEPRPHLPSSQALTHVPPPEYRPARTGEGRAQGRSSSFDDALAKILREQLEAEQAGAGYAQERRSSLRGLASSAIAGATAGVVALTYFVMISPQGGLSASRIWAALGTPQASTPAPRLRPSTLVVHNQTGPANELLELGVSVNDPYPGTLVTIRGLPDNATLTAQARKTASGWHARAEDVADVKVMPPTDFVGDMNLSIELRDSDGTALVTSSQQLSWKALRPTVEPVAQAAVAPAIALPLPTAQAATARLAAASPASLPPAAPPPAAAEAPLQVAGAVSTPVSQVPPRTEPSSAGATVAQAPPQKPSSDQVHDTNAREMSANEIAASVRRAQELLANGDVKAARALLQRAAEAHDPRAALALAKTFDPGMTRDASLADHGGPDPAQARNWYQRAREWGSPEAQRLLDALASYPR